MAVKVSGVPYTAEVCELLTVVVVVIPMIQVALALVASTLPSASVTPPPASLSVRL